MFDWCAHNKHDQCRRSYAKMYHDPRGAGMVMTTDIVYCQCKKRGCPCYVPPAERTKSKTRRRKTK